MFSPYGNVMYYMIIVFTFIPITRSHIDTYKHGNAPSGHPAVSAPGTNKGAPVITGLRSWPIYSKEYYANTSLRVPRCILLASRCQRWLHYNIISCSTLLKQMDWYKSCILNAAAMGKAKTLLSSWWNQSKVYHKQLFDCISSPRESYAFGMKMPVKQILDDAPATALCLKFHADEWSECLSSSVGLECSPTSRCWKGDPLQQSREDTEMKLSKYYKYLVSSCPDQTIK